MTTPTETEQNDIAAANQRRRDRLHELAAVIQANYKAALATAQSTNQACKDAAEIDYAAFMDLLDDDGKLMVVGMAHALAFPHQPNKPPAEQLAGMMGEFSETFNYGAPRATLQVPIPHHGRFREVPQGECLCSGCRMSSLLTRLFDESAKLHAMKEGETPALECQIHLRSGLTMIGSLARTPEGLLRFLAVGKDGTGKIAILENFFAVDDLLNICVQRSAPAAPQPESRIFQG
jgi:hypothetical protein